MKACDDTPRQWNSSKVDVAQRMPRDFDQEQPVRGESSSLEPTHEEFLHALSAALRDPLRMASRNEQRAAFSPSLAYGRHFGPPLPTARRASVLALIEMTSSKWSDWKIPLTVRHAHLQFHPGQVSLPGGRIEGRETAEQAAVREFQEELGVPHLTCNLVGRLQRLYVYNSDFDVTPVVATCEHLPEIVPSDAEVGRVIYLPLQALVAAGSASQLGFSDVKAAQFEINQRHRFSRGLAHWTARTISVDGQRVWGATAMVLAELASVVSHAIAKLQAEPPTS